MLFNQLRGLEQRFDGIKAKSNVSALFVLKKGAVFSKIIDKYYGAELVVSENHRSGALFHFKKNKAVKKEKGGCCLPETWMHKARIKKRRSMTNEKCSSGRKRGAAISSSKSPQICE